MFLFLFLFLSFLRRACAWYASQGHAGLDVDEFSPACRITGIIWIVQNLPNYEVLHTFPSTLRPDFIKINHNLRAEIGARLLNQREEILEYVPSVAVCIASHNQLATALDQFIHSEIFKVSTIGKIHITLLLVALCQKFGN